MKPQEKEEIEKDLRYIEEYKKRVGYDRTNAYGVLEKNRSEPEKRTVNTLIHRLMAADAKNQPDLMHDLVTILYYKKSITLFKMFHHEEYVAEKFRDYGALHGDIDLVRRYLNTLIKVACDNKPISVKATVVRDILYITSHETWRRLFPHYDLTEPFPPKELVSNKMRSKPPRSLLPLQAELIRYGVE